MTLEDTLRDQLRRQAADLPLPDREPGRAVRRAAARRRNRRVAAGATVALALLAVGVVPQLADGDDGGGDPVTASVADAEGAGLPLTGPLTFDWRSAADGLSHVTSSFQADDGTVYALSTGPGARYEDHPDGNHPLALYRLDGDGTWQPVLLDGDRPRAVDATSAGGLLYAISTAPDGEGGYGPVLSSSADGGDTWSTDDIGAVAPPSDAVPWLKSSTMAIESDGQTTLAVVSTSFRPNQEEVFPQLKEPGAYTRLQAVPQADGFALVESPPAMAPTAMAPTAAGSDMAAAASAAEAERRAVIAGTPSTTAVDATDPPTTTGPAGARDTSDVPALPGGTVVELVPWADLGVSGIEALGAQHQVFRHTGEAWAPVEPTGLPVDVFGLDLTVSGGRFVAAGHSLLGGGTTAYTSADGASWAPVSAPEAQVIGVGSALVSLPYDGTVAHVSPDGGATWSEIDLAAFGVRPGSLVAGVDAGPLGLALLVAPVGTGSSAQLVVSGDLVDWTVTPIEDVVGRADLLGTTVVVGADRIVITATTGTGDTPGTIPSSVTAVGTPVRED